MKPHVKYLSYVLRHKWFVLRAGLRTGAPLWRLLIHDYSKFSRAEWTPYVNRFFAGRAGVEDKAADSAEFKAAWRHHYTHNPHHWNFWLAYEDEQRPMAMPAHFVREMVADWMGAGRAITGSWDMSEWWANASPRMSLHPDTRALVERLVYEHGVPR